MNKKIIIIASLIFLAGCATTPARESVSFKGPTYQIGNLSYVPLTSVLDSYDLKYDWDSIAKKLKLYNANKEVILCVGSNIALVSGDAKRLSGPVKMRRGIIVFPKDFASSFLPEVFTKRWGVKEIPHLETVTVAFCPYSISRIVLDAGHGGKDPGAIGQYGLREKDVTLDIVKRLKKHLVSCGIKTVLTRSDDRFISLWKRADIANREKANFFISIHANAARSKSAKGFEVYYLSEAVDDNARAVAASENAALKYEDSSFGNKKPSSTLEATLRDIEYTENRVESIELAKHIVDSAHSRLRTKNRGVKAARFYVLKGAKMPSVLVEVGFISNRQEAKKLKDKSYRERVAKAIASGIINYKNEYEAAEGFTK